MARLIKLIGLTSVYAIALPCTYGGHGISIIPNNLVNAPAFLTNLLKGLGT
jgi:hypothetical protein